ncbi:MAG: nitroreductase family protein [Spirochaetes bacterium]|nr:nitroreductase family protein [Spirochaetota bacterium]
MALFHVNEQTCVKDGICAEVCPAHIIKFKAGEFPSPIRGAEEICIRCGHCVAACPTGSLSHSEMPADECPPVRNELLLSYEQAEQFLRSRRSVRVYKDKSVSVDELCKLIELARYAPTGANSQTVEWLVLGSRNELKKLAGITIDWMHWIMENKPEAAAVMNLEKTIKGWETGKDVIFRNAPAVVIAHAPEADGRAFVSGTIALAYLELAATGMGLGCCWAGYFQYAAVSYQPMIDAIGLPEGHVCNGAMMAGYPKYKYYRLPLRRKPPIIWRM